MQDNSSSNQQETDQPVNIARQLAEVNLIYKTLTSAFSEDLLEYEPGRFFKNPWHIRILYDIVDNVLTQDPDTGKIIFNITGKINRNIVDEVPRNHAKSTAISVNWPLKELYRDSSLRFVVCSNTASQAEGFLREGKNHLENGEKLNATLGSIVPRKAEKWTDSLIFVKRQSRKKDPSISTTGVGGAVLSKRADVIVFDDLLDPENTKTPEQREKVLFFVNNVIRPLLEPVTGRMVLIGTVWFKGDYLDQSMKDKNFDVRLALRALIKDSKTGEGSDDPNAMDIREVFSDEVIEAYGINAKEGVLWPERWPMKELMREKEIVGTVAFNRQYMNIVMSEDEQIIKSEWLELAKIRGKDMKFLKSYDVATCPYGPLVVVAGIDLAISEKTKADWTVHFTLGRTQTGQIKILKVRRGHLSPSNTRKMIVEEFLLFKHIKIKVENNAYQDSLKRDLVEYTDIPIEGYTTGGEKFDEYIGINSVGVLFENNKIDIPYSQDMTDEERKLMDQFISECESFSLEAHTGDMLMAFWFAINALRDLGDVTKVVAVAVRTNLYDARNRAKNNDDDE